MRKGDRTKLRIIEEASKLVASHGFDETSFQKIADACELTQQAILRHYPTKDHLFIALHDHSKQKVNDAIEASFSAQDDALLRLKKHVEIQFKLAKKVPLFIQVFLYYFYKASYDKKYKENYTTLLAGTVKQYEVYLHAGVREGLIDSKIDVKKTAETFHDFVLGLVLNFSTSKGRKIGDQMRKLDLLIDNLL